MLDSIIEYSLTVIFVTAWLIVWLGYLCIYNFPTPMRSCCQPTWPVSGCQRITVFLLTQLEHDSSISGQYATVSDLCHFDGLICISTKMLLVLHLYNPDGPVALGCRIHQLNLCKGVRPPTTTNECPGYDTKQSDGETPVMLELWGMRSIPSLPSLPVAPDRVLSMGQIELNYVLMLNWIAWNKTILTYKLRTYAKLNCLKWNYFNI